jgi:hypothetical protein
LPAGKRLSKPTTTELNERVTRRVETVVGDDSLATVEVNWVDADGPEDLPPTEIQKNWAAQNCSSRFQARSRSIRFSTGG